MTEKASFLCSFDLHVIFAPFLSHDARITPSKTNKNISKYEQTEATYFFIITKSNFVNSHDSMSDSVNGKCGNGPYMKFLTYIFSMSDDSRERDAQFLSNFLIDESFSHERQHFRFAVADFNVGTDDLFFRISWVLPVSMSHAVEFQNFLDKRMLIAANVDDMEMFEHHVILFSRSNDNGLPCMTQEEVGIKDENFG